MLIIVENYIHNWLPPTRIVTLNNPKYKSNSTFIYSLYFLCAHDPSSTWIFSYIIHLTTLLYESISMKVLVTFQPIYVGPTRTEGTWLDDPYILIQGFVAWKLYVSVEIPLTCWIHNFNARHSVGTKLYTPWPLQIRIQSIKSGQNV